MKLDITKDDVVFSQRDNEKRPSGACGATSAVNALNISEIPYDFKTEGQPEDALMAFLDLKEGGWKKLKEVDPGATYNPWNTSAVISWAVNKMVGKNVVRVEKWTLQEMIFHLAKEQAAIVIGAGWTKSSHFVAIGGFETDQENILDIKKVADIDLKKLKSIRMIDSWGNYKTGYKDFDKTKGSIYNLDIATFKKVVFVDTKKTCQSYFKNLA